MKTKDFEPPKRYRFGRESYGKVGRSVSWDIDTSRSKYNSLDKNKLKF